MKKLILALLLPLFALSAITATAETYKIPEEESIASVKFPDSWEVEQEGDSINAHSEEEEIMINIEVHDGESIEGAIEETFGYLKKNKVKVDKDSEKKTEVKHNGMDVVDFSWDGEDKDGKCKISVTIMGISDDKALVMLYWASPEGEEKFAKDLKSILDSIKPLKK